MIRFFHCRPLDIGCYRNPKRIACEQVRGSFFTRGSAPARQGTFVSAKVPKTIAPAFHPPCGRVPCAPRPSRRGKNSRPCRSNNFPLDPPWAVVLGGAQVAPPNAESGDHATIQAPLTLPSIAAEGGPERGVSEPSAGWRVPERRLERNAQGTPRPARGKSRAVFSLPTFFARAKKVGRKDLRKANSRNQRLQVAKQKDF